MNSTIELDKEEHKLPEEQEPRGKNIMRQIVTGSTGISILAVVFALILGGVLIAITDPNVQQASAYFFSRPMDTFQAIWDSVWGAYVTMFRGAIFNGARTDFTAAIRPFTDTLTFATPLIVGGLAVALTFRVGLFNIGGRGQMLMASAAATWVGFSFHLPVLIHLLVAIIAACVAGALWGGVAGFLKARTGAHEVIVTIMLNYVAFYLVAYMLSTQGLLQAPGSNNPKSAPIGPNAEFPSLLSERYNLTWAFVLVIFATIFVWWLIERSSLGFRFRAVGENPSAARVAGINVKATYLYAMLISGALFGIAGANQSLAVFPQGISSGVDAGLGFDAITVALLGRSKPWGVFGAAILFGGLKAGGYSLQAINDIPIDIIFVLQAFIVLLVAAPPLVRTIFRLPQPETVATKKQIAQRKEGAAS